jgi:pilus assembly protein Flp/PilA
MGYFTHYPQRNPAYPTDDTLDRWVHEGLRLTPNHGKVTFTMPDETPQQEPRSATIAMPVCPNRTIAKRSRLLLAVRALRLGMIADAGQDLIEYALLAGFIAIAVGAVMPSVSSNVSKVFSRVSSVMAASASQS